MNISINDMQKLYDEKQNKKKTTYNKILQRVIKTMKDNAIIGETKCVYQIPELIFGMPVINKDECINYINNILKEKGFNCFFVKPNYILIMWKLENKLIKQNQKLLENNYFPNNNSNNNNCYYSNNVIDQLNTKNQENKKSVENIKIPTNIFNN
jgi:Na+-translocating ferredoxin:NAD+ oxidoreductase RNF subunit RnfB